MHTKNTMLLEKTLIIWLSKTDTTLTSVFNQPMWSSCGGFIQCVRKVNFFARPVFNYIK